MYPTNNTWAKVQENLSTRPWKTTGKARIDSWYGIGWKCEKIAGKSDQSRKGPPPWLDFHGQDHQAIQWTHSISSREIILAFSFTEIIDMTHMLHYDAMQDKRKIIVVLKETTYFRTFQMMGDKTRIATNDLTFKI